MPDCENPSIATAHTTLSTLLPGFISPPGPELGAYSFRRSSVLKPRDETSLTSSTSAESFPFSISAGKKFASRLYSASMSDPKFTFKSLLPVFWRASKIDETIDSIYHKPTIQPNRLENACTTRGTMIVSIDAIGVSCMVVTTSTTRHCRGDSEFVHAEVISEATVAAMTKAPTPYVTPGRSTVMELEI